MRPLTHWPWLGCQTDAGRSAVLHPAVSPAAPLASLTWLSGGAGAATMRPWAQTWGPDTTDPHAGQQRYRSRPSHRRKHEVKANRNGL